MPVKVTEDLADVALDRLAKKLADSVVFLQDGKVSFFGTWKKFENSKDRFLHNFLEQDELIPAMDVTL